MNKGFTLIEILIYLTLFSMLCGGLLAAVFGSLSAANQMQQKVAAISDADFILKKFSFAMGSALAADTDGKILTVQRFAEPYRVTFSLAGGLVLQDQGSGSEPLNSTSSPVLNLAFEKIAGGSRLAIKVNFQIYNNDYELVRDVKK